MLALYDLCAVLTPCGPLKVLVGLMQERNEPLPGLLYEADLPSNDSRGSHNVRIPAPGAVGLAFGSIGMLMTSPSASSSRDGANLGASSIGLRKLDNSRDGDRGLLYDPSPAPPPRDSDHGYGSSSMHGLVENSSTRNSDSDSETSNVCFYSFAPDGILNDMS